MPTFHVNGKNPTSPFPEFSCKVPPEGTIRRCSHGVYWPEHDDIAWYCGLCNPLAHVPNGARKSIKLPRNPKDEGTIFANAYTPGQCANCNSRVHVELKSGKWECADCGRTVKAPKQKRVAEPEGVAA